MLGLSSVLAEVRRSDGAIRLGRNDPPETPPWANAGDGQSGARQPSRRFVVRLNPSVSKQTAKEEPQSPALHPPPASFTKYRQLSTDAKTGHAEIRLLKLLPGRKAEPLCCELVYAPLSSPPEYDALSYCWGGISPRAEIRCDGVPISITANLASALRVFRRETCSRLLWVDAVCINQSDMVEKQCQVPLMGQIYRQATAVQVWLGNDSPERTYATAFAILGNLRNLCVRFGWDIDFLHLVRHRKLGDYGLPDVVDDSWRSIRHLVETSWFSRTWIIQEIMLSRLAYLHCDNSSLPWTHFCIGFLSLSQAFLAIRPDIVPSMSSYAQAMQLILSYHRAGATSPTLDLVALLENHRIARASDPRDKIYAFLGIYGQTARQIHRIVPDYRHTVADTFVDAATEIVQRSPTLDILGVPRQETREGLPSWVPDWGAYIFSSSLSYRTVDGVYFFSFDAARTTEVPKHAVTCGKALELSGFCFDEVGKVACVAEPYLKQENSSDQVKISMAASAMYQIACFMDWLILSGGLSGRQYPNGQSAFDAFVRTVHLDNFTNGYSAGYAAEQYRRLYDASHVLGKPWFGPSRMRIASRCVFLQTGVMAKLTGPAPIRLLARATGRFEGRFRMYAAYNMGRPPQAGRGPTQNTVMVDAGTRSINRRMFLTKSGYIGLGHRSAREGDRVFLAKGCRTPLLLRPHDGKWELVGDCYLHGIMQGEAFDETKCKTFLVV